MNSASTRSEQQVERVYQIALEQYAAIDVDVEEALLAAGSVPISLHCWQGDDVVGFEVKPEGLGGGGIMATGNYPGRARNGDELRQDLDQVLALLPGAHKVNVHALYAETQGEVVERDELEPVHFQGWIDWAGDRGIGLDFNPTYFAHAKAEDGYTLSHADDGIREFWIHHGIASRRIAEAMAIALDQPCVNNHWIPDGCKDSPADRWGPRRRLAESYDRILDDGHRIDRTRCVDAVESKLFGLGSEDYVVGSMEFYTSYALTRNVVQCLDMGHYHPTESVHDKLSALLAFQDRLLIHTSRPVRWDSDHVVLFNEDVRNLFVEVARGQAFDRIFVALDFFDASINRIAAYVIGTRATRLAILAALLDPSARLQALERDGRHAHKLAVMEAQRTMPLGAVWDMFCLRAGVPCGADWLAQIDQYETDVLSRR